VVQIEGSRRAPNLKALLTNPKITKVFLPASILPRSERVRVCHSRCIAPKSPPLCRTYTDRHGLKDLVREALQHRSVEAAASSDRVANLSRRNLMRSTCYISTPCANG
jgi:ribonuclease D